MAKRDIPEINAGSMADIAFLLLIFFLVTTTMDTDTGLIRKLPPPPEDKQEQTDKINQRNIFEILVNSSDQLLVEGDYIQVTELKDKAIEFIKSNPSFPSIADETNAAYPNMPEFKVTEIPNYGSMLVSKQIISLQNDNGTSYEMYIKVQNELIAAYKSVRNEVANQKFGMSFTELVAQANASEANKQKMKAVKKMVPQRISEAEPKKIGGN